MGTIDAEELILFTNNEYTLYKDVYLPIIAALLKKKEGGTYDSTKAIKAFHPLVVAGARAYIAKFPGTRIPAAAKRDAEQEYRDIFEAEYNIKTSVGGD